jgi:hypothetical protein
MPFGGKTRLSLTQNLDECGPLLSGKCVYQAHSSHSILSDVRRSLSSTTLLMLSTFHRRINEHQSTSIIHIPHHYSTITGLTLHS